MSQLLEQNYILFIISGLIIGLTLFFINSRNKKPSKKIEIEEKPKKVEEKKVLWSERLTLGLSKSRKEVWSKMASFFQSSKLTKEQIEELEELLYGADLGPTIVGELIEKINEMSAKSDITSQDFRNFLFDYLKANVSKIQNGIDQSLYQFKSSEQNKSTKVIMVVGVNGAGKTTTIGKLATRLTSQGANVVVGACDTFRAAAVDQLEVWCKRAGAKMVRAKDGGNPSGVGYEALQTAINDKADFCILDTAGRLHTKENLMTELSKSKNVLKKLDPLAPHHTLLVIDAITGQNALRQAHEFHKTLGLTGLIFTKCDGSSKAGSAIGIIRDLQVPITYIGVGETVEDLDVFNLDDYLNALLGVQESNLVGSAALSP